MPAYARPIHNQAAVKHHAPTELVKALLPSDLAGKIFFIQLPEGWCGQRGCLHDDNRDTPQQIRIQFSPWCVADDGALNDVVGLSPADHVWSACERVFRPQWADLFYAISGTSTTKLSHLHYVLRVRSQLLHKGLTKPGSCLPAPVEIFIGDW